MQEGLTRDKDGPLLRHGEGSTDGSSFDGRATLSADGNTLTDVVSRNRRTARRYKRRWFITESQPGNRWKAALMANGWR